MPSPHPGGDLAILLLAVGGKIGKYRLVWQGDPGMQPGGGVGTNLIRLVEWENVRSDDLKPDRIVGYRGIVAKWGCSVFLYFWSDSK